MKERIAKIIENENMSSTMFAERLGIGKAVVSHILNGRNNPSLDVVSRIMKAMPHIDTDWLVNGEGEMLKAEYKDKMLTNEGELFVQEGAFSDHSTARGHKIDGFGLNNQLEAPHSVESKEVVLPIERVKKIKQIIIYYDDNTFETFFSK